MRREIFALRATRALRSTPSIQHEDGVAIVMAMMALGLMTSLGLALLLTSSSEMIMAGHFRDQRAAFYAAEAIVERGMNDIAMVPDWATLVDGSTQASFVDGPPGGTRTLQDGTTLDLQNVLNMANCQQSRACAVSDLNAVTAQRPWGVNNPRWQLYAYGPLRALLPPGAMDAPWYVVLLVGDDPLAADTVVAMRAEAFGPRNAHTAVELTAARPDANTVYNDGVDPSVVRILSWREVR
jgi:Tfp pilus assembly protein PilX